MRGSGGGGASGAGVQRKGAQKGTLTSGADVPIGLFLSGVLMRGSGGNMDAYLGFSSSGRTEETGD